MKEIHSHNNNNNGNVLDKPHTAQSNKHEVDKSRV